MINNTKWHLGIIISQAYSSILFDKTSSLGQRFTPVFGELLAFC